MIKIEFPDFQFNTKNEKGVKFIFDIFRKKWLFLSPEEWVRQNMLQYMTLVKQYPSSLFAIEKEFSMGELKKRCDIVVYDRNALPWMIVECKEMNTPLNAKVLEQVLLYHISLPAKFLVITNGKFCFGFEKRDGTFFGIDVMPEYEE
ncbi:MAG: type I restriction enzyme HsdR N-terminal domain-containing protein [Ginsengibacter sp.]